MVRRHSMMTPLHHLLCAALVLVLAAGCRSAEPERELDRSQTATCTVYLPDGRTVQPECWLKAGDLFADGNGQLLVTVGPPDAGTLTGGLRVATPWDVRIRGPLHTGTFRFAALADATDARLRLVSIDESIEYALAPKALGEPLGDIEIRLLRVDSQPAQIGPRLLSVVGGSVDFTFAQISDPSRTVVARVSF